MNWKSHLKNVHRLHDIMEKTLTDVDDERNISKGNFCCLFLHNLNLRHVVTRKSESFIILCLCAIIMVERIKETLSLIDIILKSNLLLRSLHNFSPSISLVCDVLLWHWKDEDRNKSVVIVKFLPLVDGINIYLVQASGNIFSCKHSFFSSRSINIPLYMHTQMCLTVLTLKRLLLSVTEIFLPSFLSSKGSAF